MKVGRAHIHFAFGRVARVDVGNELRDFIRMVALSRSPTGFCDAHIPVFETWIVEKVRLTDSELLKYRLNKPHLMMQAPSTQVDSGDPGGSSWMYFLEVPR